MSDDIRPFTAAIPDADLDDLRARLARTRWPDAETVPDWTQGVPLAYMQELVAHWRDHYDWRRAERDLNAFDQFITRIDGVDIHFLHVRSPVAGARPLLMTHGWPGSVFEFLDVIGPLTDPASHGGDPADAFHLVCPSLPGFGFSGKPTAPGWNVDRIALAWGELMARLGYGQWYAQGGDWGGILMQTPSFQTLEGCLGMHLNFALFAPDPAATDDLTEDEQGALAALQHYQTVDSGYATQQGTRPQTLGYGLADSPAGQAAWIIEKFWSWSDCDGHPEHAIPRDRLLDDVTLYWLTDCAASSARIYWESLRTIRMEPVTRPTGISIFPKEFFRPSRRWAEQRFEQLGYYHALPRGGHFAAMEQPELFVEEVRACFRALGG